MFTLCRIRAENEIEDKKKLVQDNNLLLKTTHHNIGSNDIQFHFQCEMLHKLIVIIISGQLMNVVNENLKLLRRCAAANTHVDGEFFLSSSSIHSVGLSRHRRFLRAPDRE
jgi:hypothetical protein